MGDGWEGGGEGRGGEAPRSSKTWVQVQCRWAFGGGGGLVGRGGDYSPAPRSSKPWGRYSALVEKTCPINGGPLGGVGGWSGRDGIHHKHSDSCVKGEVHGIGGGHSSYSSWAFGGGGRMIATGGDPSQSPKFPKKWGLEMVEGLSINFAFQGK